MTQIALPLTPTGTAERIVVGPSNQAAVDALKRAAAWPFRTAILIGPPRSGKSLLARWFEASGAGEAIDDAEREPEDALFHRWNRAQASGAPLLLVSGSPPGEWRIELPDLASRLGAALILEIGAPDDSLLRGLLEEHAARRGLALGEGAAAWLLPRIERSHAAVEALVETIDRLSLERKQPVTISLLRDALGAEGGEFQPRLI
ncbi:MAG TPA: ATPase [Novosphingobium sp.]|nr:ATPase [Novosphingobium sp.]